MQSGTQAEMMTKRRMLEPRYAYYRRCQQFRKNGAQCKAPAMKGEYICYQHAEQAATARRRQESLRALRLSNQFNDFSSIQRAIAEVAQALIDGRIDSKTAGRLAITLQNASLKLWRTAKTQKKCTTEARRRGEFTSEISSAARDPYRLEKSVPLDQPQSQELLSSIRPTVKHRGTRWYGELTRIPARSCRNPLTLERLWSAETTSELTAVRPTCAPNRVHQEQKDHKRSLTLERFGAQRHK